MSSFVFRVQDKDGRGPWKPGFSYRWVITRPDHDNLPPMFIEFENISEKMIPGVAFYGSACSTIKKLRRWFTKKEYKTLKKYGYCAVIMRVDSVIAQSNIQLIFTRLTPLNEGCRNIKLY